MSQLATLQSGINRVKRFRSGVRMGSAWAMLASVLLWVLLGAFVLDVTLHMGVFERVIVLGIFIALGVWAFKKYVLPAMRVKEDPISVALMIERQQGIGTDLVAAIQFSDQKRTQYGSGDLRQAVVDYTKEVSGQIDYLEGFSREELVRRTTILGITLLLALAPAVAFPDHAMAFLNRFGLGNAHYPTNTIIRNIDLPGKRAVYGSPVTFRIQVDGELPDEGEVLLRAESSGLTTSVKLTRVEPDPNAPKPEFAIYTGTLARALDNLTYKIEIGDAYTDKHSLELIPLPVVDVELDIQTPDYAAERFLLPEGRQRIALEGSRVIVRVTSKDELDSATMTIDGKAFNLRKDGEAWVLDNTDPAKNPLARVAATMRYEVQVARTVDDFTLGLERPISGVLQVRADQPPRVGAATVTRFVLPNASPKIRYKAVDDYALGKIVLHKQVVRAETPAEGTDPQDENHVQAVILDLDGKKRETFDTIDVSLAELGLEIGDRVTVTFEAFDYRGKNVAGKSAKSERIVFQVTDRKGVLDALRELDAQMDKKLDQIINAQLGGGASP